MISYVEQNMALALCSESEIKRMHEGSTDSQTWWDQISKLGQTNLGKNVNVRIFGGTNIVISVGLICSFR